MGAVERLGGKKSDVVRVKMFIAVSVFPLWHLFGHSRPPTRCSPLELQEREDSITIGNVYREFFGHETIRPSPAAGNFERHSNRNYYYDGSSLAEMDFSK